MSGPANSLTTVMERIKGVTTVTARLRSDFPRTSPPASRFTLWRAVLTKMSAAKPKPTKTSGSSTGLYKADSVKVCKLFFLKRLFFSNAGKDVAESLGITNLPDPVASALASDVEYRVHQVIEVCHLILHECRYLSTHL